MSPNQFRAFREEFGLTQEALAKPLGVAKLTISQYETGFRKPSKTIIILLNVLRTIPRKKAKDFLDLMSAEAESLANRRKAD